MNPVDLHLPMPLFTPRLQIRPRAAGEGRFVARAIRESLDHLKPWMPWAQRPPRDEDSEEHCRHSRANFDQRRDFTLSIWNLEGTVFLGSTGFHEPNWTVPSFSIGYWIHKDHEGRGYVAEAVNALTRYGFAVLKANRLEIRCDSRNARSLSVMKKLGYAVEGTMKNEARAPNGELRDTIVTARIDPQGLPPLEVRW